MDAKELHAMLVQITRARDATYNVLGHVLDTVIENLMKELRLQEVDNEQHIARLRHTIGVAVLALESLAEGIRLSRVTPTNESNEVH